MIAAAPTIVAAPVGDVPALRAGRALDGRSFAAIFARMVLDCCKWDPQVGDVSTLARWPLVLRRPEWDRLRAIAQRLAAETLDIERALLRRPELHRALAVPGPIRRVLRRLADRGAAASGAPRVMRFDFHPTRDGWRVSEVNSDVPGGYAEASAFPAAMAEHFPGLCTAGDPGGAYARAIADAAGGAPVGLVSATGFMEDLQVVSYLARRLREENIEAILAGPSQVIWHDGRAQIDGRLLAALVRFIQTEWLPRTSRRNWQSYFRPGYTRVCNPAAPAVLSESKRLPLLWDALARDGVAAGAWRQYLPETRDPRHIDWRRDGRWVLKSAYCNTGDDVCCAAWTPPKRWRRLRWELLLDAARWVAQRRFDTLPVDSPDGPVQPCIGVYVIDGRACGAYARVASGPVVDYRAVDAALLIEDDSEDDDEGGHA